MFAFSGCSAVWQPFRAFKKGVARKRCGAGGDGDDDDGDDGDDDGDDGDDDGDDGDDDGPATAPLTKKFDPDGPAENIFEGFLPVPDGPAEHIFEGFLPVPDGPAEPLMRHTFDAPHLFSMVDSGSQGIPIKE